MPTFDAMRTGYSNLWRTCEVRPEKLSLARKVANKMQARKVTYQEIEAVTGVPWQLIGCLHYRESDNNFGTYLGNGDSLARPTVNEPKGRGPFPTFEVGAIDALRYDNLDKELADDKSIERKLYCGEKFNGFGTQKQNSNYVWAGTNHQERGGWPEDHVFDPNYWDTRVGVAAILKVLDDVTEPQQPTEKPSMSIPTLTVDWHMLEAILEKEIPDVINAIPVLAPYRDSVVAIAKVLLHTDPSSMMGTLINTAIDQLAPTIATVLGPFGGIAISLAKTFLHATPP